MTTVIMCLYESEEVLEGVRESLLEGGFEGAQIHSLHRNPRNEPGFFYHEHDEIGEEGELLSLDEARELLLSYEFEKWEVEKLLTKVQADQHLLLVRTGDELSGRAMELLNQEPAEARMREDSFDDASGGLTSEGGQA